MNIWIVAVIVVILNVPFGYWRANTPSRSLQWFLAIHVPVAVVVTLRIFANIGWQFFTFPVLIGAFSLGQLLGGRLRVWYKGHAQHPLSSCLINDVVQTLKLSQGHKGRGA
ncbi:MAG: hypothetical protein HY756_11005 [Nitrospirae bacterium]|nr:hypothetical protein [Nitrospirota bacterium]